MEDILKDLERRKKLLAKDKQELSEAVGVEKELMNQLRNEFQIETLEDAKAKHEEMEAANLQAEKEIQEDHERIKEQFPW